MRALFISILLAANAWTNDQTNDRTGDPRYDKRATRRDADFSVPVAANEIKVMAYNLENLFDITHDDGKDDFEFLPKENPQKKNCESQGSFKKRCYDTDWTQAKLELKLQQIKRAVLAQGSLPDVLAVEEVENENVVAQLAKLLGYDRFVMTNSPDARGIDVGLLFNETKLRYIDYSEKKISYKTLQTRNLLGVNFETKGASKEVIGFFVNHWPSQGKESEARVAAAEQLKAFVEEQAVGRFNGRTYHAILLGDFNTIEADAPNPLHEVIANKDWPRRFSDVQTLMDGSKNRKKVLEMPPGTYYYFGEGLWNRLDRIFVSRSLVDTSGIEMVPDSFRVIAPEFMCRAYEFTNHAHHLFSSVVFGVPKGYDHNAMNADTAGYSDHFPIVMKLREN